MAELQIQIAADVNNAIRGLNQVQSELDQTGKDALKFSNSVDAATSKLKQLPQVSGQATTAVGNLSRIVQDAPFGFKAISNNLQPLFDNFTQLKSSTGSLGGALKAFAGQLVGPAGIGLAFAAVTSLITVFSEELFGSGKAAEKAKSDTDKLKESINGIYSETAKEASAVTGFVAILKNETETRERKLAAIKELQQIQPDVFAKLKLEGDAVLNLDSSYKSYLANLKNVIAVKIKQAQLDQLIQKQLKLEGVTLTGNEKLLRDGTEALKKARINDPRLQPGDVSKIKEFYKKQEDASKAALDSVKSDIEDLKADILDLSTGIEVTPITPITPKIEKPNIEKVKKLDFSSFLQIDPLEIPVRFSDDPIELGQYISPVGEELKAQMEAYFKRTEPLDASLLFALDAEELKKFSFMAFSGLTEAQKNLADMGGMIAGYLTPSLEAMIQAIGRGENAFKAFGEGVKGILVQVMQKLAATAILAGVLAALFPTGIGGSQGFGAIFGKLLGFKASGGPVSGNNPYVVGERGPELFVPSVSGQIIPNHSVGSFMGRGSSSGGSGSVLRGQDIILAYARTQRSQLRVNG